MELRSQSEGGGFDEPVRIPRCRVERGASLSPDDYQLTPGCSARVIVDATEYGGELLEGDLVRLRRGVARRGVGLAHRPARRAAAPTREADVRDEQQGRGEVDLSKLEARFGAAAMRGKQAAFARRVAFETRDYVPVESGTLRDSEPLASDYESGDVRWDTPYAAYVAAMPESSMRRDPVNPNARANWPQAAKDERMGAWRESPRSSWRET